MKLEKTFVSIAPVLLATLLVADDATAQSLEAVEIASGFSAPLYLCSPPGDTHRLFVVEQGGVLKIIKDGSVLATPFLDISSITSGAGEQGLLGLAFHPDYDQNGRFFVSYTNLNGNSVVREYGVSAGNPDVADPGVFVNIIGPIGQPYTNHNGGCIQFGADGMLYFGLGDGGSANDPGNRAQDPLDLHGKMLRLDIDIASPHIPPDNPFVGDAGTRDEIWSLGLRNPWRFSFDRMTGDLWIADVGQYAWEEVDFEPAGAGGRNYGWRCMEGTHCTGLTGCTCNDASLTLPVHEYSHSFGCSITGGYLYRGQLMPDYVGRYFFSDYCTGTVWSFDFSGGVMSDLQNHTSELAIPGGENPTSFGEDANGELYMVDANAGQIWLFRQRCTGSATNYCTSAPNSAGSGSVIGTTGTFSISDNNFSLTETGGIPSQFGLFFYGPNQISFPFGDGFRCVGGGIWRLSPAVTTDGSGNYQRPVDFTAPPADSGGGQITGGSTWNFQFWYRDPAGPGGSGFNTSNGVSVTFCP